MKKATTTFQEGNYGCFIRVDINKDGIMKFEIEDDFFDNGFFDNEEKENIKRRVNKANVKELKAGSINHAKGIIIREFNSYSDFYFEL